jgi:hypothetical protein
MNHSKSGRAFSLMGLSADQKPPSMQVDDSLYTIEHSQASGHVLPTAEWFLPRNVLCYAGFSIPIRSLSRIVDQSSIQLSVKFICIPSSVEKLPGPRA